MREMKIAFLGLLAVAAMVLMIQLAESSVSADEAEKQAEEKQQWEKPEALISVSFPEEPDGIGRITVNLLSGAAPESSRFATYEAWSKDLAWAVEKVRGKKTYWSGAFDVAALDSWAKADSDGLPSWHHKMVADLAAIGYERCHFASFTGDKSVWINADGLSTVGRSRTLSAHLLAHWPADELVVLHGTPAVVGRDLEVLLAKSNVVTIR